MLSPNKQLSGRSRTHLRGSSRILNTSTSSAMDLMQGRRKENVIPVQEFAEELVFKAQR